MNQTAYQEFLRRKIDFGGSIGLPCEQSEVNPIAKPHCKAIVSWAVQGGRRGIFTAFGLHKTVIQLEIVRLILTKSQTPARGLIVMPLGVRQEFKRDAEMLATGQHERITDEQRRELYKWQEGFPERILRPRFIRTDAEIHEYGIYLTNYESVREGKIDPTRFQVISLDEAAILRGFGGTKTFREFMRMFEGTSTYRFVATATPSPNEYIELLAYAAFLGIMDVGQAKTRFFKRDSTKADKLTLHAHKEKEFWLWVSSWAMFLQKPSDLGYSDEGYELPPLDVRWHEIATDHAGAGSERSGQHRLLKNSAIGVTDAAREKRTSLPARIAKLMEIRAETPGEHRLIWHDLEAERHAIEDAVPEAVSIYGTQDLAEREQAVIDFSDGKIAELAAKPVIAGSGCNFQRHCAHAVFLGIGFKFNDFIQAIHRIHRFLQTRRVRIDLIYTEAEREVKRVLEEKWRRHEELVAKMTEIIREYGLSHAAMENALARSMGIERQECRGVIDHAQGAINCAPTWRMVNNDCVDESARLPDDSLDLVVSSIPFSTQYEYTPSYNDFGHTEDNPQFWEQMDFLTPELYRALRPGRCAAIHVKDRIAPGGFTGLGFQTAQPFHAETIFHFIKHGFAYMGMKTVVTDVVRENNQTYRLGWTEQCKDGSKMGWGMPEYVLLFRKPPTDRTNSYADIPVVKDKGAFSLARWQVVANGFDRSSGNRLLAPEDLRGLTHQQIYRLFRETNTANVYDFEAHVALGEWLAAHDLLPVTFNLLPPHSWHPDAWTDVARMRTLNGAQSQKGKQMHLCPLQFDIVDRLIVQLSNPGELVYDPFAGLGTVPYCAVKLGRRGYGVELNPGYFADAVYYCRQAEEGASVPDLFDMEEPRVDGTEAVA